MSTKRCRLSSSSCSLTGFAILSPLGLVALFFSPEHTSSAASGRVFDPEKPNFNCLLVVRGSGHDLRCVAGPARSPGHQPITGAIIAKVGYNENSSGRVVHLGGAEELRKSRDGPRFL